MTTAKLVHKIGEGRGEVSFRILWLFPALPPALVVPWFS